MLGFLGSRAGTAALGAITSSAAWGILMSRMFLVAKNTAITPGFQSAVTAAGVVASQTNPVKDAADSLFGNTDEELKDAVVGQVQKFIDEGDFLIPSHRDGSPITPRYYVMELETGRQWFIEKYNSYKTVRAAANRARFQNNRRYHSRGVHPRGRYSRR